jgi:hypothetical protein
LLFIFGQGLHNMPNLNDYRVTDNVDDVLAVHVNRPLDATIRGELSNVETLAANKTLTDADFPFQVYTPTANRDVTLPAEDTDNHPFYIVNTSASYTLTVKNDGGSTIGKVPVSSGGIFASTGTDWHIVNSSGQVTISDGKTVSMPATGTASTVIETVSGTTVNTGMLFGGYTLAQIAQGLIDAGVLMPGWFLKDDFTDTRSAGAVNGTSATPGPGTRTVTDTGNKISVGSGVLNLATGATVSDGVWYPISTRTAGKTLLIKYTPADVTSNISMGFDNTVGSTITDSILFGSASGIRLSLNLGSQFLVGAYAAATAYMIAAVQRSTGVHFFIKGGTFTNWTLLYSSILNSADVYPGISIRSATTIGTIDFVRIPGPMIAVTPIGSDSFNRTNGAIGTTDGAGAFETGGSGLTWTNRLGTWNVLSNAAAASALTGGIGQVTVSVSTVNVMVEAALTRSAGNVGLVLRWADANNFVYAYHDGTNAVLIKVVGGAPTTLINTAATYVGGARLVVSANATKFRMYYNDALVGAEQTISDAGLQTGTAHGLYTSNTGNSIDSFALWAKGNGGEYATFDTYTV